MKPVLWLFILNIPKLGIEDIIFNKDGIIFNTLIFTFSALLVILLSKSFFMSAHVSQFLRKYNFVKTVRLLCLVFIG